MLVFHWKKHQTDLYCWVRTNSYFLTSSDKRIKKDIEIINDDEALNIINNLETVNIIILILLNKIKLKQ